MELIDQINSVLTSPDLSGFLLPFKIVAIIVSIIFAFYIAYYAINQVFMIGDRRRMIGDFFSKRNFTYQEEIFNRWKVVEKVVNKEEADEDVLAINLKLAIVSLESLLFDMFKAFKYEGADLRELLPQLSQRKEFGNPEVMEAIIYLSDKIKADPNYKINPEIVKKIVEDVKAILIKLKII